MKKNRIIAILLAATLLLAAALGGCQKAPVQDSGKPGQAAPAEPSLDAFKADCATYAKNVFGVVAGQDGINEDSIYLTIAPMMAGFWPLDPVNGPTEEQYDAFYDAFEASSHWDHAWDEIGSDGQTELTYEQSAAVLSAVLDFCYEKAVEKGWTPGDVPEVVIERVESVQDPESDAGSGASEVVIDDSGDDDPYSVPEPSSEPAPPVPEPEPAPAPVPEGNPAPES